MSSPDTPDGALNFGRGCAKVGWSRTSERGAHVAAASARSNRIEAGAAAGAGRVARGRLGGAFQGCVRGTDRYEPFPGGLRPRRSRRGRTAPAGRWREIDAV